MPKPEPKSPPEPARYWVVPLRNNPGRWGVMNDRGEPADGLFYLTEADGWNAVAAMGGYTPDCPPPPTYTIPVSAACYAELRGILVSAGRGGIFDLWRDPAAPRSLERIFMHDCGIVARETTKPPEG